VRTFVEHLDSKSISKSHHGTSIHPCHLAAGL
jgi:hypothetical protein